MRRCTVRGAFLLLAGYVLILNFSFQQYHARETTTTDAPMVKAVPPLAAPSPSSANERNRNDSFAACLLVMDDNHYLTEWLAYHYHVLPLRHLIVAVDPRSRTSPAVILNRWKDAINITVWWKDTDFVANATEFDEAESWISIKFQSDNPSANLIRHRARQRLFYYHCMQEHKKAHRKWTLLTDSDEFLTVNYDTVRALRSDDEESVAPPISEPGSVLKLLQHELQYHPGNNITSTPCVQIPRIRFGTVETDPVDLQAGVPADLRQDLNASHLATLRWRKHAAPTNYQQNRISKVIVDLSRVEWRYLEPVDSIHKPVNQYCKRRKLHIRADEQLLLIHHYLGTWAQYSYRSDARAGNERSQRVSYGCSRRELERRSCFDC
jgi:Glycosyl transferase family 2